MYWEFKYLIALTPILVTVGGWQLAVHVFEGLGCQGDIKHLQPCLIGTIDLRPWFGIGLFWFPLASFVATPLSVGWLTKVAITHRKSRISGAGSEGVSVGL
jgi:hypothetical protein